MDNGLPRDIGRYRLYDEVASGGMATVHVGRLRGPAGFARTVAIKRLHPQFAHDPEFVSMFLDEARLAARIHHPNVAAILDVVALRGELFLVMEYVRGETLSRLLPECQKSGTVMPARIAVTIVHQALLGLHAAHEARDHRGTPLDMVHRDVSPQNIMVGADGITRMLDFGVAKAATRIQTTGQGQVKGKLAYMAPEQLRMEPIDRRTDIFAAGVVLWEALTGRRLFSAEDPGAVIARILTHRPERPSQVSRGIPEALDAVVLKALARDRTERFDTALAFAKAIEGALLPVGPLEVAEWVHSVAAPVLEARERTVAAVEIASETTPADPVRVDTASPPTVQAGANSGPSEPATVIVRPPVARGRRAAVWSAAAITLGSVALAAVVRMCSDGRAAATLPQVEPAGQSPSVTMTVEPAPDPLNSAAQPGVIEAPRAPENEEGGSSSAPVAPAGDGKRPEALSSPTGPQPSRPRGTTRPASKPSSTSCSPPYEISADGVKRFKPECFR